MEWCRNQHHLFFSSSRGHMFGNQGRDVKTQCPCHPAWISLLSFRDLQNPLASGSISSYGHARAGQRTSVAGRYSAFRNAGISYQVWCFEGKPRSANVDLP